MQQILCLWATSRSRSTAFERMMFERGDFHVFHEPFGPSYYFSDERKSQRAQDVVPKPEYTFDEILYKILQKAHQQAVFIKEQAYQAETSIDDDTLAMFTNTFLLRHPKEVIPSLFDKMPDFTHDELGYEALYKLFSRCTDIGEQPPVVVDSHDLVHQPVQTIKAYCRAVNIPFFEEALTWTPTLPSQFVWWEGGRWLQDVGASRGLKVTRKHYVGITDHDALQQAYERSKPYYDEMITYKLPIEENT